MKWLTYFSCWSFLLLLALPQALWPASPEVNLDLLRDVICHQIESTGNYADKAVSRNGLDWGACQIKYWSAVHFGGVTSWTNGGDPAILFQRDSNRAIARLILQRCWDKRRKRTVLGLAACYKEPNSPFPAPESGALREYAEKVDAAYKQVTVVR